MRTAVALFTRDLRLHDNPMLRAALDAAERVHALFVHDDGIRETRYGAAAGRRAFLDECLADLDESLRRIGGALDVRRGDVAAETVAAVRRVGADAVFATADVSAYARERERRLAREVDLRLVDGSFVVPPGAVAPTGRDHYEVFSPYHRAWSAYPRGDHLGAPRTLRLPGAPGEPRKRAAAGSDGFPGGEAVGRKRMLAWLRADAGAYERMHDDLAGDGTSRLSPYLHFGCISARELANRAADARRRGVRPAALLAGLLRPAPLGEATDAGRRPPPPRRPLGRRRRRARCVEGRPHRVSARRCRHAPAPGRGLDAQQGPARHRLVPRQGSRHRLARGRATLLRPAPRRRRRPEHRQLAVGGRHRGRHATQSRVQPDRPGEAARPGRGVRPSLGARARRRPRPPPPGSSGPRTRRRSSTTARPSPRSARGVEPERC